MSSNINIDNNFAVQPSFDLGGVDSPKIRARLPDSRSFTQLEQTPNKGQLVSLEEANQALEPCDKPESFCKSCRACIYE